MTISLLKLSNVILTLITCFSAFIVQAEKVVSLEQAISLAQQYDPWLHGSKLRQKAIENRSIAAGALPDPTISIGMMNLPTDTWNFEQEGMTQLNVGVSQLFPRGNSLALKESQLKIESTQFPLLRENRKSQVKSKVSQLWLDAYLAQQTVRLIQADRELFEQMAEVAKANYSNVVGKTSQQDVIRAQLEIIQLEDRLTAQKQKFETSMARLNEWVQLYSEENLSNGIDFDSSSFAFAISSALPNIRLQNAHLLKATRYSRNTLAQTLVNHPKIIAIDVKHKVSKKTVELVKQKYKPQWGVNATYAYRDNMPSGDSRSNLFSVGVTFDLPLFTENKQDKLVAASFAESEAVKTEKLVLIKQMLSTVEKELKQLKSLSDRQSLYQEQIIKQTHEQAEAALTAYTNNDGDFAEVVRARIAELNASISALRIDVDVLKTIARINYFFTKSRVASDSFSNKALGEQ